VTFWKFCPLLLCGIAANMAGCNRPRPDASLPPDVESYAIERTPAIHEKFQKARSNLLRIEEGKKALLTDLKKVNRKPSEDPTMQQMLVRQETVENEIKQLRELMESNYLRERKFLLGLTADGVPSAQGNPATPKTVPSKAAQSAQNIRAHAPAILATREIPATYPSSFNPENLKNLPDASPSPVFAGTVGGRCWLMNRYMVEIEDGLYGLKKGTALTIVEIQDSFIVVVTDEKRTFHVPASLITTDAAFMKPPLKSKVILSIRQDDYLQSGGGIR